MIAALYGVPVPWEPIAELAGRYGVTLIEDAAQGHGASWRGNRLGSLGEISVLSFGRGKGWTGGGGGALLLRGGTSEIAIPTPSATGGWGGRLALGSIAQWLLGRPSLYGIPAAIPGLGLGETRYKEPVLPESIPAFAAALLMGLRSESKGEADHRRRAGIEYARVLQDVGGVRTVSIGAGGDPGYLRFPVRLPEGARSASRSAQARRLGVAPGYPTTLDSLDVVRARLLASPSHWPGADELVRELVTIPTHSKLTSIDRADVLSLLDGILQDPTRPEPRT